MRKTALITGASSGLGKEFAKIHAKNGGDLVIVARSKDKLQKLKEKLEKKHGVHVSIIEKDLTEPNAAQEVYNFVKFSKIEIDYLINNAGFGGIGKFHERAWAQDLAMIQLNIIALTDLTRKFLPDFVERNQGKILNVSSTASLMAGPMQAVYFATKAFVTSFSNAIAEELHDTKVTVTTLMPGATKTDFGKTSGMDKTALFQNAADSKVVAQEGYDAMLEGALDIISGVSFPQKVMMKAIPITPKSILLKQIRKMQEPK
ncbi:SDR family oxidoreductase [Polaribacter sp. MED152]|uniref:SDR family NAD(P)-dependent oxidoreductase n=1 Tax=Polaribacter sp. MED152 TaxID=313598 RepID=UPI0000689A4A|nr:SDR family oxidoreductase [Polaribacter sp. MED152]EAQ40960.1 short chain dehydrogenase [Polaribacter sp. MED152]